MKSQKSKVKSQNYSSKFKIRTLLFSFGLSIIVLQLTSPSSVFAASINLSNGTPSTISDSNQEYQVNVSLSINADDGTVYYLRGAFYQSGTNNYCGYTWNGSSWFNGPYSSNDGWKNLLQVTVSSSSASTVLKAKLDSNDNSCKNSGNYNFKVQRYTQGGSGTFDSQNEQSLTVNIPSPTPTPTLTPVPTAIPTSSPTNTPVPTATPQPQSSPTVRPSATPTKKPGITPRVYDPDAEVITPRAEPTGVVLGETTNSTDIDNNKPTNNRQGVSLLLLLLLMGGGIGCIVGAVILSAKQIKKRRMFDG